MQAQTITQIIPASARKIQPKMRESARKRRDINAEEKLKHMQDTYEERKNRLPQDWFYKELVGRSEVVFASIFESQDVSESLSAASELCGFRKFASNFLAHGDKPADEDEVRRLVDKILFDAAAKVYTNSLKTLPAEMVARGSLLVEYLVPGFSSSVRVNIGNVASKKELLIL